MEKTAMVKLILAIFLIGLPCLADTSCKNTVSLGFGFPELLDLEYQYCFDPAYVAIKPGFIAMVLYYTNNHAWNFYPSIRFGVDAFKIGPFRIGPQFECAYFNLSWAQKSTFEAGIGIPENTVMVDNYYSEFKDDYLMFCFGPAVRYLVKRLELQLSLGLNTETTIEYSKTTNGNTTTDKTRVGVTEMYPMARISAGYLF
jgi:predicted small secreted protein